MSYDTVASISQVVSLLMFIGLFIGVLVYAFWPGNKQRFDQIQHRALELDDDKNGNSNKTGGAS